MITLKDFKDIFRIPIFGPKVICVGYWKTGTTTIGRTLNIYGYRNTSFKKKCLDLYGAQKYNKLIRYAAKYDSMDDMPWNLTPMLPLLFDKFPNSKFILTERDPNKLLQSRISWGKKRNSDEVWTDEMSKNFIENYWKHNKEVKHFFKDKPDSLLCIDVSSVDSHMRFCDFLGIKPKMKKFPIFNATKYK